MRRKYRISGLTSQATRELTYDVFSDKSLNYLFSDFVSSMQLHVVILFHYLLKHLFVNTLIGFLLMKEEP